MRIDCDIRTQGGQVTILTLRGSAGASDLTINDNTNLDWQNGDNIIASYAGRFEGDESWEWLTTEFMRRLRTSTVDMQLRIDCLRTNQRLEHIITSIELDVEEFSIETDIEQQNDFYYVNARAIDETMLKASVDENAFAVSRAAEDNAGWPIVYYKTKVVANIDVLSTAELKAIQGTDAVKTIKVFFPHQKVLSTLEFDQFGLKYNDITTLNVLAETFHKTYNDNFARPEPNDIVYIEFLDQYFEVTNVEDVKTNTNKVLYYTVTMQFITDRLRVAKDSDVLDLSDLAIATSQKEVTDLKRTQPEIIEFDKRKWSSQILQFAEQYITEETNNYVYGVCYDDELLWCKFEQIDNVISYYALTDVANATCLRSDESGVVLNVCKLAMFDKQLSNFDRTMYYTSYTFPRTLTPLQLIEHQTANI